uniref:Putative ovule protein n=1 Tax=Solanum chacoense TaxID=4108 RepID=A0A0V0GRV5_SOLCH
MLVRVRLPQLDLLSKTLMIAKYVSETSRPVGCLPYPCPLHFCRNLVALQAINCYICFFCGSGCVIVWR